MFLTAAHCAEDGERVGVTFDPAYEDGDKVYYGTFEADPLYPGSSSDSHDIAVVVLDKAIKGITPAELPEAGSLSDLSSTQHVHLGRLRRLRGHQRARRPPVPLRRRPAWSRPAR